MTIVTGVAPSRVTQPAVAKNEYVLVMTSSPGPMPSAIRTARRASVPDETPSALLCFERDPAHCHRTPLVGETVYFFAEQMVCELCKPLRHDTPTRSERVHSCEHELTVRRRIAA